MKKKNNKFLASFVAICIAFLSLCSVASISFSKYVVNHSDKLEGRFTVSRLSYGTSANIILENNSGVYTGNLPIYVNNSELINGETKISQSTITYGIMMLNDFANAKKNGKFVNEKYLVKDTEGKITALKDAWGEVTPVPSGTDSSANYTIKGSKVTISGVNVPGISDTLTKDGENLVTNNHNVTVKRTATDAPSGSELITMVIVTKTPYVSMKVFQAVVSQSLISVASLPEKEYMHFDDVELDIKIAKNIETANPKKNYAQLAKVIVDYSDLIFDKVRFEDSIKGTLAATGAGYGVQGFSYGTNQIILYLPAGSEVSLHFYSPVKGSTIVVKGYFNLTTETQYEQIAGNFIGEKTSGLIYQKS